MFQLLNKEGPANIIFIENRPDLVEYADALLSELPEQCADCPAAYLCSLALKSEFRSGFPVTPTGLDSMKIRTDSGFAELSGQAHSALRSIVREANSREPSLIRQKDDECCLNTDTKIDINASDPYDW